MKNLLIVLLVILAGGSLYYMSQQSDKQGFEANGALEFVPADTAMFSGQLRPFPVRDYLLATSASYQSSQEINLDWFESPEEKFFISLYGQYMAQLDNPDELLKTFGMAHDIEGYLYMLGLVPVLKVQIKDAAAFYQQLDLAEQKSGWNHTVKTVAGMQLRAYTLTDSDGAVEMLVGDNKGWLTMTMAFEGQQALTLEQSLGLKAVPNNLTQTTLLRDIIKRHGFIAESISYINHKAIVSALTQGKGMLGEQLTQLFESMQDDSLTALRTPQCQQDLSGIAANWPMTVMGVTEMNVNEHHTRMDIRTVVESNNQAVLDALKNIRGFIAPMASKMGDSVVSVGLGINSDNLVSSLTKVWQQMVEPEFQCTMLADLQYELTEANPAMLGMFTGMAQGSKGVSLVVSNYEMDDIGDPKSIDAMLSIAAENPQSLFAMASSFLPPLAGVQLPADGSPLDVTDMLALPVPDRINLALKGQNLVLYTGKQSELLASELASADVNKANGMVVATADYNKLLTPLFTMIEAMGETVPPEMEGMQHTDMKILMGFDVNNQGLVMQTDMAANVPAN